ncbi:exodeoxyribonuclease VII large subunit [Clostridium sp. AM58-1XD]|uniref:exodeoxyribonuclease VII large subunit n=1 Tax=Clostridium sp. AM58-1XD TaxID=2292307 RepID=UPI000E4C7C5B|nr:exodeoxyribonuclease VII large subunit [Clostridium sp. AM58-1XD]RGZ00933.1 exodeoxyribonuclease VII large subunit [Clostridium sp. AM58-1XD]
MASIYSVSQVNAYIRNLFVQDFALNRISVKGEVSNCKYHTSGHIYFTLKDGGGTLACVMFAGQRKGLAFQMREGQQVVVSGTVDVYERDGRYQLYAKEITLDGTGDLFRRFEKLRNELEEMGMFSAEYKQPIPKYAKTVGIVTAATGAAIRDIMNIAKRRNPYVQLVLYPALVQGESAKYSIVKGIQALDALKLDVLIVGRGGGSIEDLWAFNEEIVAKAIFNCQTPVISAVGHETDVTIADYVADMRAPTPSAAAELAVFDYYAFEGELEMYQRRLMRGIGRVAERKKFQLHQLELRMQMYHPGRRLNEKQQRLADLEDRMRALMERKAERSRHRLSLLSERLEGLSPVKRIAKGYGFVTDQDGRALDSVDRLKKGDTFRVQLADGRITGRAEEIVREDL